MDHFHGELDASPEQLGEEDFKTRVIFNVNTANPIDMLSDWMQAEKAVLWDIRGQGSLGQLSAIGLTLEELEELLLSLAADTHKVRTGMSAGGIIVEDGEARGVLALAEAFKYHYAHLPGGKDHYPGLRVVERVRQLILKRDLR